jgi:hypothetical protein
MIRSNQKKILTFLKPLQQTLKNQRGNVSDKLHAIPGDRTTVTRRMGLGQFASLHGDSERPPGERGPSVIPEQPYNCKIQHSRGSLDVWGGPSDAGGETLDCVLRVRRQGGQASAVGACPEIGQIRQKALSVESVLSQAGQGRR